MIYVRSQEPEKGRKTRRRKAIDKAEVVRLRALGLDQKTIAFRFKVTPNRICQILVAAGLRTDPSNADKKAGMRKVDGVWVSVRSQEPRATGANSSVPGRRNARKRS